MKTNTALILTGYGAFLIFSLALDLPMGKEIGANFFEFAWGMLKVLPCAFILIGLFEVWVKTETIERHFGAASGLKGYLWSILLAGTAVGGVYVAFPVAHSLYQKGASYSKIFTYLGAAAITRIPMTTFEASFIGIKFTLIRFLVSLPLVILSSMLFGAWLDKKGYQTLQ